MIVFLRRRQPRRRPDAGKHKRINKLIDDGRTYATAAAIIFRDDKGQKTCRHYKGVLQHHAIGFYSVAGRIKRFSARRKGTLKARKALYLAIILTGGEYRG